MVQSMTGYGKAEALLENGKITVEIRTLNGKNADITLKSSLIPKDKELELRKKIASVLQRGTIDVFITWEPSAAESAKQINVALAQEYYRQMKDLSDGLALSGNCSNGLLGDLLRMPDVVDARKADVIGEASWPLVDAAFDRALEALCEFRRREGAALRADVTAKVEKILGYSHEIEPYEHERTDAVREKILSAFADLNVEVDKSRLEQEMIFYIEKLDINEERVRLRQHCAYFLDTLEKEEFPGRKIGFIAQEMGREINTTGSKANHSEIQRLVTCMKDELEKIKEQSLNIL
ncbi:MAG: YicC family protein [Bacteroidales bacterium]|nr:YicC family protein [Bacteroidales bacterium]